MKMYSRIRAYTCKSLSRARLLFDHDREKFNTYKLVEFYKKSRNTNLLLFFVVVESIKICCVKYCLSRFFLFNHDH